MTLSILTPVKEFYVGEIKTVLIEAVAGRVQIRPRYAPYIFALNDGIMSIETEEGKKYAAVMSGFAKVMDNKVTVLTDAAEWPEDIDENRAMQAKERALANLKAQEEQAREENRIDRERAYKSLCRAEIRLKLLLTRK